MKNIYKAVGVFLMIVFCYFVVGLFAAMVMGILEGSWSEFFTWLFTWPRIFFFIL